MTISKKGLTTDIEAMNYIIKEAHKSHDELKKTLAKEGMISRERLQFEIIQIKNRDQIYKAILSKIHISSFKKRTLISKKTLKQK